MAQLGSDPGRPLLNAGAASLLPNARTASFGFYLTNMVEKMFTLDHDSWEFQLLFLNSIQLNNYLDYFFSSCSQQQQDVLTHQFYCLWFLATSQTERTHT